MTPSTSILIVDDDPTLRLTVRRTLELEGHTVHEATTGAEAIAAAASVKPDAVVLDLGLPDCSGYVVMREIRNAGPMPALLLTGRDAPAERAYGLDAGADDYLVKPASLVELAARVRVLLRRAHPDPGQLLAGNVDIDVPARAVRCEGVPVDLTRLEFDLLVYLLRHPGTVHTRADLLADVWQSSPEYQTDAVVTEYVRRLRLKLPSVVVTSIRGLGYRYDPPCSTTA